MRQSQQIFPPFRPTTAIAVERPQAVDLRGRRPDAHKRLGAASKPLTPMNASREDNSKIVPGGLVAPAQQSKAGRRPWSSPFGAVLAGGLIAGTIDIGAACLINQRGIPFILHAIAGGLLAERSFSGGAATAALGLVLQELMGILIAAIYVYASNRLPDLRRRWIVFGLAYGVVIFIVMNYIVVPLSAWHHVPQFVASKFVANLAAMLLFGLIVAAFAGRLALNPAGSPAQKR